eukprot:5303094-Lingulodinium_polyedra.AAC.1
MSLIVPTSVPLCKRNAGVRVARALSSFTTLRIALAPEAVPPTPEAVAVGTCRANSAAKSTPWPWIVHGTIHVALHRACR